MTATSLAGTARLAQPLVIGAQRSLGTEGRREKLELAFDQAVALFAEAVVDPAPLAAAIHDACRAKDAELPRSVRLADAEGFLDVAHAQLAVDKHRDDPQARLIAESAKHLRERADIESRCGGRHESCISRFPHISKHRTKSCVLFLRCPSP